MATPSTRTPIRLARGTYSNLNNSIADLQEGEIVYATDQNNLYVKEGSVLILVTTGLLDEDNLTSNSALHAASQQSIKAYVDSNSTSNLSNTANGTSLTVESSSGTNTALPAATTSAWGVMTDEDKTKLDGIATSANNYTHPTSAGNVHIPSGGSSGQFLKYTSDGTAVWAADNDTTYSVGDGGLTTNDFTNTLKTKLDGIATGATVGVAAAGGTFTGSVTFEDAINENVYNCTGTELEPNNGMIQYKVLGGNTTLTESIAAGQSMLLMVDDGSSYTITWPTMTWVGGSAPTLATSGYSCIELWKIASTLYGCHIGDVA